MTICGATIEVELIDAHPDDDDAQLVHCNRTAGHREAHSGPVLWTDQDRSPYDSDVDLLSLADRPQR